VHQVGFSLHDPLIIYDACLERASTNTTIEEAQSSHR